MGSAASRFGTTLFSSLAFARLKSSSRLAGQASGEVGGGSAGDEAAAAAAAAAEAAEAAAEEKAARTLAGHKSAGLLGAGSEDVEEGEAAHGAGVAPRFGALEAGPSSGALSAEASDAALAERSPSRCLLLAQQQAAAALVATGGQQGAVGGAGSAGGASASGIARVTDGVAAPGGRSAQGRLDFVMQVGGWLRMCWRGCIVRSGGLWKCRPSCALLSAASRRPFTRPTATHLDFAPSPRPGCSLCRNLP